MCLWMMSVVGQRSSYRMISPSNRSQNLVGKQRFRILCARPDPFKPQSSLEAARKGLPRLRRDESKSNRIVPAQGPRSMKDPRLRTFSCTH